MKTLDVVFAWALVVLGVVHSAATITMRPFSMGAVWFFAGGAAIIMAGLLNVIRIQQGRGGGFVRGSAILSNFLIIAVLVGVTWFARHRLGSAPQVLIAWVLAIGELVFSFRGGR